MSEALARRLAAMTGLALAAAIALWWLGSTRLALDHGTDAGPFADGALQVLLLLRALALALVSVRIGALRGWRPGATAGLGLIAPAWPVVILAWSASTRSAIHVMLAEVLLLVGSAVLPMVGMGVRRLLRKAELAVVTSTLLGTALVALAWATRGFWDLPSL